LNINFRERVLELSPVPPIELERLLGAFRKKSFKSGQELERNLVAYITKGVFRAFYREDDGREILREFACENDFICYVTLYQTSETKDLIIESVESSETWVLTQEELDRFYASHSSLEQLGRKVFEEAYMKKLRRERQLLSNNLSERYSQFQKDYGHLEARIPQYMVASFLGASPVSLSRIRSK
jgi:CRP-like cAMP-binding protein